MRAATATQTVSGLDQLLRWATTDRPHSVGARSPSSRRNQRHSPNSSDAGRGTRLPADEWSEPRQHDDDGGDNRQEQYHLTTDVGGVQVRGLHPLHDRERDRHETRTCRDARSLRRQLLLHRLRRGTSPSQHPSQDLSRSSTFDQEMTASAHAIRSAPTQLSSGTHRSHGSGSDSIHESGRSVVARPTPATKTIVASVVTGAKSRKVSSMAAKADQMNGSSTPKSTPARLRAATAASPTVASRATQAGPRFAFWARPDRLGVTVGDHRHASEGRNDLADCLAQRKPRRLDDGQRRVAALRMPTRATRDVPHLVDDLLLADAAPMQEFPLGAAGSSSASSRAQTR